MVPSVVVMTYHHENQSVIRTRGLTRTYRATSRPIEAVHGLDLRDRAPASWSPSSARTAPGKTTTLTDAGPRCSRRPRARPRSPVTTSTATSGGPPLDRVRRAGQRRRAPAARPRRAVSQARAHGLSRARRAGPGRRAARGLRPGPGTPSGRCPRSRAASAAASTSRSAWSTGAGDPVPGRAVDRARPAEPRQPPGAGAAPQRDLGTTIVLTTHYLEEADASPTGDGDRPRPGDRRRSAARLKAVGRRPVVPRVRRAADASPPRRRCGPDHGRPRRGGRPGRQGACAYGRDRLPGLVTELAAAETPVRRMEVVGPTLDDVFLNLTGRSLRESNETTGHIDAAVNADEATSTKEKPHERRDHPDP